MRYGRAWRAVARQGMEGFAKVRYGLVIVRCVMLRCGALRHGVVSNGAVGPGRPRHGEVGWC